MMTFDLDKILISKRAIRQRLAARPVVEKLAMLDTLRERALVLRTATSLTQACDNSTEQTRQNMSGDSHENQPANEFAGCKTKSACAD